jgi:hypothetical protein
MKGIGAVAYGCARDFLCDVYDGNEYLSHSNDGGLALGGPPDLPALPGSCEPKASLILCAIPFCMGQNKESLEFQRFFVLMERMKGIGAIAYGCARDFLCDLYNGKGCLIHRNAGGLALGGPPDLQALTGSCEPKASLILCAIPFTFIK